MKFGRDYIYTSKKEQDLISQFKNIVHEKMINDLFYFLWNSGYDGIDGASKNDLTNIAYDDKRLSFYFGSDYKRKKENFEKQTSAYHAYKNVYLTPLNFIHEMVNQFKSRFYTLKELKKLSSNEVIGDIKAEDIRGSDHDLYELFVNLALKKEGNIEENIKTNLLSDGEILIQTPMSFFIVNKDKQLKKLDIFGNDFGFLRELIKNQQIDFDLLSAQFAYVGYSRKKNKLG
ncbi:hypothetical protein L3V83_05240 [Thiotrichales bacterium 19X7-9]|nr:hypothetical protein [Thiotrichales bacterium 19X7-9]